MQALCQFPGVTQYLVSVPERPTYPYILFWTTENLDYTDSIGGIRTEFELVVGTTAVALTADAVYKLDHQVNKALLEVVPSVEGRIGVRIQPDEPHAQPVQEDNDVTLPETGTHPHFAVRRWRIRTQPISYSDYLKGSADA